MLFIIHVNNNPAMKLLYKDIKKDHSGQVTLIFKEAEDMWHTYSLLQVGAQPQSHHKVWIT